MRVAITKTSNEIRGDALLLGLLHAHVCVLSVRSPRTSHLLSTDLTVVQYSVYGINRTRRER